MKNNTFLEDDFKIHEKLDSDNKRGVNTLYQQVRRSNGEKFLRKVKNNETMLGQSIDLVKASFVPSVPNVSYTPKALKCKTRLLDQESKFDDGGVTAPETDNRYIFGVMLGTDGGSDNMIYKVVPHDRGYKFDDIIPFRYIETSAETAMTNTEETKDLLFKDYAMRHEVTRDGKTYAAYLVKKLDFLIDVTDDSGISIDGFPDQTLSDVNTASTTSTTDFMITTDDLLEYFSIKVGNPNGRHFNSFMFVSGTPVEVTVNGKKHIDFRNVIVSHKINTKTIYMPKKEDRGYTYIQRY